LGKELVLGLTQQIGASSLIRPGVIDNTAARPSSPYEGQVIFQKDTDQLLVWNGTAWVIPNQTTQNPEGLELIKVQTVGSAVGSVTVTDVFSATYHNYKIVYSGGVSSSFTDTAIYLGSTLPANGYYSSYVHAVFSSGSALNAPTVNGQYIRYVGISASGVMSCAIEVTSPFESKITTITAPHVYTSSGGYAGIQVGFHDSSASFTSFTLMPASGTFTGGTVKVYGYRNSL